nr:MAG TPA: hypothetical protein [Caudoviricetes sp.]
MFACKGIVPSAAAGTDCRRCRGEAVAPVEL